MSHVQLFERHGEFPRLRRQAEPDSLSHFIDELDESISRMCPPGSSDESDDLQFLMAEVRRAAAKLSEPHRLMSAIWRIAEVLADVAVDTNDRKWHSEVFDRRPRGGDRPSPRKAIRPAKLKRNRAWLRDVEVQIRLGKSLTAASKAVAARSALSGNRRAPDWRTVRAGARDAAKERGTPITERPD